MMTSHDPKKVEVMKPLEKATTSERQISTQKEKTVERKIRKKENCSWVLDMVRKRGSEKQEGLKEKNTMKATDAECY